jgi:hypothetical protein
MINDFLTKKISDIDPQLLKIGFVAGSSIAALLSREDPKDIDFFFEEDSADFVDHLLRDYICTSGEAVLKAGRKKGTVFPVFITDNAITYSNGVQVILKFSGKPNEVVDKFDFAHTKGYWSVDSGVIAPQEMLLAAISKNLIYTGSNYPISSLFRTRKFIKRGWVLSAGNSLKIALDIWKLDLRDPGVLKEQLYGIDVLYLLPIITYLDTLDNGPTDLSVVLRMIEEIPVI